mgnify:CR=1 FL=1
MKFSPVEMDRINQLVRTMEQLYSEMSIMRKSPDASSFVRRYNAAAQEFWRLMYS